MGPAAATESLRTGLGMGADRAVLVDDDAVAGSDLVATSRVLAAVLDTRGGRPGPVRPADLRRRRRRPLGRGRGAAAAAVRVAGDEAHPRRTGAVVVERETEVGNDTIEATLPAVVAVSDAINEPRYTSLKGMMAAKKKPLDTLTASDLGLAADAVGDRRLADRRARHRRRRRPVPARSRSRTTAPPRRRSSTTSRNATSYE